MAKSINGYDMSVAVLPVVLGCYVLMETST